MKTITVVGVGALGSHLVMLLRSLNNVQIRVIDFDRVEMKNTKSQFHSVKAAGKSKVESLRQLMEFLFQTKIQTRHVMLSDANAKELLGDSFLIVDCLDNGSSRTVIQEFAKNNDIPCVHGAIDANGTCGMISWNEKFTIDFEPSGEVVATCENGEHLPFITQVSASLARSVQFFLEEGKKLGYMVYPTNSISI